MVVSLQHRRCVMQPERNGGTAGTYGHRRTRVLVEDPDPAWHRMLDQMLTERGYEAVFCPGPEGLAGGCSLVAQGGCPLVGSCDVVLTSLNLDRADNREVFDALRRTHPRTPVVALVSRREAWEHPSCLYRCAVEYLPTSPRDLFQRLEEAGQAV
jgi:CheY-like chemotaxis protein